MANIKKPPIGVLPKKLYEEFIAEDILGNGGMSIKCINEKRLNCLSGAISRYTEAQLYVDIEWVKEYNEKLELLGIFKSNFKLQTLKHNKWNGINRGVIGLSFN